MFHRLGPRPPSSVSTGITPGYRVSSSHLALPSRFDATIAIALDYLAGRPPPEESTLKEVLLAAEASLGHISGHSGRTFVLKQSLQHADRGIER